MFSFYKKHLPQKTISFVSGDTTPTASPEYQE
ncbi:hypothetical protein E2C01_033614 [Portunus trituberculatus]|uniref:Uncharacterized protein n=1 Tax=Portunus trituberculatus TaxID=210409 RepID=A0A5B7EZ41_PORTR|nr:hypothetical protein [Portunus trituberculatus]